MAARWGGWCVVRRLGLGAHPGGRPGPGRLPDLGGGGVFFRPGEEARNFSYAVGGQLHLNIVGHYDRFDTPFLYTPVPATFAILAGAYLLAFGLVRPLLRVGHSEARARLLATLWLLGSVGLIIAPRRFLTATLLIVLTSGLAVWIFARSATVVSL